jgi:hypothetical protein
MFFPNDYQFYAETACNGEPQVDKTVRLLALLQEAFELPDWGKHPSPIPYSYVASHFEEKAKLRRPDLNTPLGITIASPDAEVRVMIDTGAKPLDSTDADAFNILLNGDFKKPDPKFWLQAIELLRPFEARLAHCKNKNQVEVQERIHRNYPRKPSACLGLDYYAAPIVANLGGKAHVLNTPAHRTSEFLDGVLIELVPGYYFDPNNPEHLEIQRQAMRHLGIDN